MFLRINMRETLTKIAFCFVPGDVNSRARLSTGASAIVVTQGRRSDAQT